MPLHLKFDPFGEKSRLSSPILNRTIYAETRSNCTIIIRIQECHDQEIETLEIGDDRLPGPCWQIRRQWIRQRPSRSDSGDLLEKLATKVHAETSRGLWTGGGWSESEVTPWTYTAVLGVPTKFVASLFPIPIPHEDWLCAEELITATQWRLRPQHVAKSRVLQHSSPGLFNQHKLI